jgi:DNA-binding MarR family transcriptional regulator
MPEVTIRAGGGDPESGRPAGPDTTEEIIDLLRRFSIEADRFVQVFAERHGLHRTDLNALAHVWRAGRLGQPLTPGELARLLSLSPAATTAVTGRLERAGHVERVHDTADRRRVHLRMRPPAQDLAVAFFAPLGRHMRAAFDEFSAVELDLVARFLTRVLAATSAAADEAHGG